MHPPAATTVQTDELFDLSFDEMVTDSFNLFDELEKSGRLSSTSTAVQMAPQGPALAPPQNRRPQMPIFHKCSNITININYSNV